MKRERAIWGICIVALAALALGQTIRLEASRAEVAKLRDAAAWPDRPTYASTDPVEAGAFKPLTQPTIPQDFWGEFAEDVHQCGGEGSMLIAASKIAEGEDVTGVTRVYWKQRGRLDVEGIDKSYANVAFRMEMSQDRAEISFIHTNRKRVVQRCSMRAHTAPEPKKSAVESETMSVSEIDVDAAMNADANMALDVPDE